MAQVAPKPNTGITLVHRWFEVETSLAQIRAVDEMSVATLCRQASCTNGFEQSVAYSASRKKRWVRCTVPTSKNRDSESHASAAM